MSNRRKLSKNKLNLLVDTSFLLPALGVNVEEAALKPVKRFYVIRVHYLEVSILEAFWGIIKIVPVDKIDRVRTGIEAIRETYRRIDPPPEAYVDAYKLYHDGHKDYIDNLIYSTSKRMKILLLTMDEELISFLSKKSYPINNILTPDRIEEFVT